MRELVLPLKCHLQRDAEGFDGHNRDGTGGRADGQVDQRVLAAVFGSNLVNHQDGEDGDKGTVEEEA